MKALITGASSGIGADMDGLKLGFKLLLFVLRQLTAAGFFQRLVIFGVLLAEQPPPAPAERDLMVICAAGKIYDPIKPVVLLAVVQTELMRKTHA